MLNQGDSETLELLKVVKRELSVSWDDNDTDQKLMDMMLDAERNLNHTLGAECDYLTPGMERRLFLNYMLYAWNDILHEFESAYLSEIIKIRHFHEVKAEKEACSDD